MTDTADTPLYTVTLHPGQWRFAATGDETLLAAAARAGVRIPSACRNGTCRTCMCRLAKGEVAYPGGRPGLTADEMEEGWILACVARARADLRIDAPGAAPLEKTTPRPIVTGPRR
jgi:ferredoxin